MPSQCSFLVTGLIVIDQTAPASWQASSQIPASAQPFVRVTAVLFRSLANSLPSLIRI